MGLGITCCEVSRVTDERVGEVLVLVLLVNELGPGAVLGKVIGEGVVEARVLGRAIEHDAIGNFEVDEVSKVLEHVGKDRIGRHKPVRIVNRKMQAGEPDVVSEHTLEGACRIDRPSRNRRKGGERAELGEGIGEVRNPAHAPVGDVVDSREVNVVIEKLVQARAIGGVEARAVKGLEV